MTLNTVAECICFLAALLFLYGDNNTAWRLAIVYALLTFATESTGLIMRKVIGVPNLGLYNCFVIVECSFTSYFFYTLFKPYGLQKKWLFGWLGLMAAIYTGELFYTQFKEFVTVTAAVMSIGFVLACFWFYYLKMIDEQYEPLLQSAQFWWVSGALFFYFGSTACNIFFDYLTYNEVSTYDHSIRYIIFNILNVILYSFWSYSFICRYRQRKSSL